MTNVNTEKMVYTVEDVQVMLGIGKNAAYNLIKTTNQFRHIRIGRSLRVIKPSFDEFINRI